MGASWDTAVTLGQTPSMSKPVLTTTTSTSLYDQFLVPMPIVQVCNHGGLLVMTLFEIGFAPDHTSSEYVVSGKCISADESDKEIH